MEGKKEGDLRLEGGGGPELGGGGSELNGGALESSVDGGMISLGCCWHNIFQVGGFVCCLWVVVSLFLRGKYGILN